MCECCFHFVGTVVKEHGAVDVSVCCHCGKRRELPHSVGAWPVGEKKHGPHRP